MIEFQRLQRIENGKVQNLWAFITHKKEFQTKGTEGKKFIADMLCINPNKGLISRHPNSFIKQSFEDFHDFSQSIFIHDKMRELGLSVVDYYLASRNMVITPVMSGNGKVIIDRSENLGFIEHIGNGNELRKNVVRELGIALANNLLINPDAPAFIFDLDTNLAQLMFLDLTSGVAFANKQVGTYLLLSLLLNNSFIADIPETFVDSPDYENRSPSGRPARAKIYNMIAEKLTSDGEECKIPVGSCMQQLETSESTVRRAVNTTKCCDVVNSNIEFSRGHYGLDFYCGRCILSKLNHPENPLKGQSCPIRQAVLRNKL